MLVINDFVTVVENKINVCTRRKSNLIFFFYQLESFVLCELKEENYDEDKFA